MKKYVLGPNAARQLKKLLRGSGEVSRRDNMAPGLAFGSEYANPYAVQWAQSANDGEGGWIIWLPGDALLVVDGQTVDVREGLDEVGGDYPEGWYLLGDAIEDDGTLNLDIHFPDPDAEDDDAPTEIYTTFSDGEDDEDEETSRTIHVAICDVATDADTGARSVQQFVTSMILMGDGGVTSMTGDDEESVSLDGDVLIDGHKCGLVVKTQIVEGENGKPKAVVYLDVKGRSTAAGCSNKDEWGCQPITLPGGGLAHYLGCRPLDLSNLGGGGGGGGGDDDPDDPDDPDNPNPPGGDDDCVTSLNGEDGDLVLRLLEGWLEIVKGGQAKKAIGTVVTSVSGLIGDLAVIGGKKIRVEQEGNSLKISYDDEKEADDTNPFPDSPEVCSHPSGGGGVLAGGGGGGGGGVQGGGGESGGGDSCCGGASATGGTATGTPEPGVSGKPKTGGSGANGKEVTDPPSGGTSLGGKEAGGGLFNGSTIPKKRIEDTNTHGALTDTKKMTTSPFAKDPNWHGSIEDMAANAKKPIYTGTHNALTDTKKMNESPFKRKKIT